MAGVTFFEGLTNRGAMPALVATWSFAQARHKVIAENVANMSTPNYKAKHLDYGEFQKVLGQAMENRGVNSSQSLELGSGGPFRLDRHGRLTATPASKPGQNVVFHDGTNLSIESEMSELASNALLHEITTTLLKRRFDGLRKAIRGRT